MTDKDKRRKAKRYPVRWPVAVVFDKATGKPILHTQTLDLSVGGAALHSVYADLTDSLITLMLAYPSQNPNEVPNMLKLRARIVSTVQTPGRSVYRHGVSFLPEQTDGVKILAGLLGAQEPEDQNGSTAEPPAESAAPAGTTRLARLRELAHTRQAAQSADTDTQDARNARVSEALEKCYRYLKELVDQLNVVKPAYGRAYHIVGAPAFDELSWESGRVDFRSRTVSPTVKLVEFVSLGFRLSAGKKLRAEREAPGHEKLQQALRDVGVEFTMKEARNARGTVERAAFEFPCEVVAILQITGNFETGRLLLRARNVERFGTVEHALSPANIHDASLDELSGFILGETGRIGPLLTAGG